MKSTDKKLEFIKARAAGKSYATIAKELRVSASTIYEWNKELAEEVGKAKAEALKELYTQYGMTAQARLEVLGKQLDKLNNAIEQADLTTVPAEKLLEIRLKTINTIRSEYIEPTGTALPQVPLGPQGLLMAYTNLLERSQSGLPLERIQTELQILSAAGRAYDMIELQKKVDQLEKLIAQGGCKQ